MSEIYYNTIFKRHIKKETQNGILWKYQIYIKYLTDSNEEDIGPNIIKSDFIKGIEELKLSKDPGVNNTPAEMLKMLEKTLYYLYLE